MISAYCSTYVTIGTEDYDRIVKAREVIRQIYEATTKVNETTETGWLSGTIDVLDNILSGKPIDC